MPKIEWDDSFSVHNTEIDGQHKKWIGIYNNMLEILMGEDKTAQHSTGEEILKAMLDYCRDHFKFEEEYMHKINYPGLLQHRRMHKDFDNQIYTYYRGIQEGRTVLNTEILSLINNWFLNHIVIEDKKYALFFEMET